MPNTMLCAGDAKIKKPSSTIPKFGKYEEKENLLIILRP